MRYAQVIIETANAAVDRRFTYAIPQALPVQLGHHVMVPFGAGNKPTEAFVVALTDETDVDADKIKEIARIIEPYPVLLPDQLTLAAWMCKAYHCLFIDALSVMIPAQLKGQRVREKTVLTVRLAEGVDWQSACSGQKRAPRQYEVLSIMGQANSEVAVADLSKMCPQYASAAKALVKKGLLTENTVSVFRRPYTKTLPAKAHTLNDAQMHAVSAIGASLRGEGADTVLLHGVTGSGKTEVYLTAIAHCIEQNRQAIVLVPEISLTPQTVGRFQDRFGDRIAVLHSRLSVGERFDEWRRIRLGVADIVIGARSAVFAPTDRLGLIIVDEEHETSYQSEKTPRYSAIEVAAQRVKQCHGTLVLGSATPSLLSYYRALSGRYTLCTLPNRVEGRPLPTVEVVNMKDELLMGNNGIFSDKLVEALSTCIANGHQAMLFINRRGYSTFVSCRSCGYVQKCDNCDISLTYHKAEGRTRCHYCGAVKPLPVTCPNCGKRFIKQFGLGTEQVEEAVKRLFPTVKCLRMDADTMQAKGSYDRILSAFASQETQVLIGTQMIAKGHDFPNVTLVGIVAADTTLNLPDFRAPERTFQLLTQVAGRAGRDAQKGVVVLQTYAPQHPVIRFAKEQDYNGFYQYEIMERKKMLYPPFSMFLRIVFADHAEQRAADACLEDAKALEQTLRTLLGTEGENDILLLSAAEAPVAKISGCARYQILLKVLRTKRLPEVVRAVYAFHASHKNDCAEVSLEVNPQEMF